MDKIERVARAVCEANGYNPDEIVEACEDDFEFDGQPTWRKFEREARIFIAAQAALSAA